MNDAFQNALVQADDAADQFYARLGELYPHLDRKGRLADTSITLGAHIKMLKKLIADEHARAKNATARDKANANIRKERDNA